MHELNWVQWGRRNNFIGVRALAKEFKVNLHYSHVKKFNFESENIIKNRYMLPFATQKIGNYIVRDSLDLGTNRAINNFHLSILKKVKRDSIVYTIANGMPILDRVNCRLKVHEQVSCALELAELRNRYQNEQYDITSIYERELRTFECSDVIACPSIAVSNYVKSICPKANTHICLYPRPEIELGEQFEKKNNQSRIKFIFAGRLEYTKGVDTIFSLAKKFPLAEFHLVGDAVCSPPPLGNIFNHGKLEQKKLFKLFSECDCLLFPSYSEGSSFVTLEAMSLGLPGVVSFQSGSHYKHGDNGFLFDANNIEECEGYIEKIIKNPEIIIAFKEKIENEKFYGIQDYNLSMCEMLWQNLI
ncbi:hypothetical protein BGP78_03020 [Pseudoalteromonas sp. MSK9-3]|uniref:glycosyltransferase family 4 protein n=1 Tax=Pseudoalteromonas sp. MSK9-3 TaxID=1897633 RepID=UPI000E6C53B1|nr:glycosyltransferase [Pseudoalteromonas sp. MSK9-3]RJE75708.1 hypothetical protein BGP78_03020 [Pseudoalteromonas sp. MSK9-3]